LVKKFLTIPHGWGIIIVRGKGNTDGYQVNIKLATLGGIFVAQNKIISFVLCKVVDKRSGLVYYGSTVNEQR